MTNHCDRRITHPGDSDTSFVLLYISSKSLLPLECYLPSPKRHIKISKYIKQTKRYISITKKSDTSITVTHHATSPTVLYPNNRPFALFPHLTPKLYVFIPFSYKLSPLPGLARAIWKGQQI